MADQLQVQVRALADDSQAAKNQLESSLKKLAQDVEIKIKRFDISQAAAQIKTDLERQLKDVKINATFIASSGTGDISKNLDKQNSQVSQLEKKLQSLQLKIDTSQFDKQLIDLEIKLKGLSVPPDLQQSFDTLKNSLISMKTEDFGKLTNKEQIASIQKYQEELTKVTNQTKILSQQQAFPNQEQQLKKLTNQLIEYGKANSKMFSDPAIKQQYNDLINSLKNGSISADQAKGKILELRNSVNEAGKASQSFSDKLQSAFQRFGIYASLAVIVRTAVNTIKDMTNNVIELENQMNNLRIITGATASETQNMIKNYQQLASQVNSTTLEIAESAEIFLRQGRSQAETAELIKTSQVFSKIAFIDTKQAADLLTSSINGYGIAAKDAMSIVDKMSAIDMKAATSSEELATAMQKTAASAKLAGLSYDEILSYIAAISETTRQSADVIGTSLKTMISRIQQVKLGKLVDPETEEDISNVETVLKQYNIALRDSQGLFRDTGAVMADIAEKWKTLENTEKSEIATQLAGIRQREQFIILMENFDRVLELQEISLNSAGSAMEKFNIFSESTSAKLTELKNQFQILSNTIIDSQLIKNLIEIGTAGLSAFNNLIKVGNGIPATIMAIVASLLILKSIMTTIGGISLFQNILTNFKNLTSTISIFIQLLVAAKTSTTALAAAEATLTTATNAHTIAAAKNIAVLLTNPYTWIAIAGVALIAVIINLANATKEHTKTLEEQKETISKFKNEINDLQSAYDDVSEIENRTEAEERYLAVLKDELETKKELLKIAQQEAYETEFAPKFEMGAVDIYTGLPQLIEIEPINELNSAFKEYNETLEAMKTAKTVEEFNKLNESALNQKLALEETYKKLKDYESAGVLIDPMLKTWMDSIENLIVKEEKLSDTTEETKQTFSSFIQELSSQFSSLADIDISNIDKILSKLRSGEILDESDIESLIEFKEALQGIGDIDPAILSKFGDNIEDINRAISESADVADAYLKVNQSLISSLNQLSSAFAEQKEYGELSIDTIFKLIDAGYAAAIQIDAETGAMRLDAEMVTKLTEAKLNMRIADAEIELSKIEDRMIAEGTAARNAAGEFLILAEAKSLALKDVADWENFTAQIEVLKDTLKNFGTVTAGTFSSSFKSAKKEKDVWLESWKEAYAALKHERDMDRISAQEYYDKLKQLDQDYFSSQENIAKYGNKYIEQRRKNEEELYKVLTDIYKKRQEAAIKAIDAEIKALEKLRKSKDEEIEQEKEYLALLEKRKSQYDQVISAVVSVIDEEIKQLQEQKKALQQVNDEEERKLELIKLEEALRKAQESKTIRIFREDIGFTYEKDVKAIEEAQKALDKFNLEEQVREIDKQIDALNEYKQAWQDVATAFERDQNRLIAAQILGRDWEQQIIEQRTDVLDKFQGDYYRLNQKIENDVKKRIETLEKEKEELNKNIDTQVENLQKLKDGWANALNIEEEIANYEISLETLLNDEINSYANRLRELEAFVKEWNKQVSKMKTPKSADSYSSSRGYATGTMSAPTGWATTNELGNEIIIRNPSGLSTWLEDGDGVLPANLTKNIFNLARNPIQAIRDAMGNINIPLTQNQPQLVSVSFGNLNLPNVKDPTQFANTVSAKLTNIMTQFNFSK